MEQVRWERIKDLLEAAVELAPERRRSFLAEACADDPSLRSEVEDLLEHHQAGSFLENSPAEFLMPPDPSNSRRFAFFVDEVAGRRFRIVRFIGAGGMGEVYEAMDLELDARVALKTLRPEIASDSWALSRFKQEIQLARRVTHPNVCRIFDSARHRGPDGRDRVFFTMELLDGESLAERLRRQGQMSLAEAQPLIHQMAEALNAAHESGVIHRDFKPSNVILVEPNGAAQPPTRAVVTDFGLARVVAGARFARESSTRSVTSGRILGTLAYMAPEQLEGRLTTPATDVYALGLVVYEMLTGRKPFPEDAPFASAVLRLKETPPSPLTWAPELGAWREQAILRCLEIDPAARFQSARQAAASLQEAGASRDYRQSADLRTQVAKTKRRPGVSRLPSFGARTATITVISALFLLALVLGGADLYRRRTTQTPTGSEWMELTDFPDSATSPVLSPDGRMLAFIRGPDTFVTGGNIYVKLLPNGEPMQLTHDGTLKQDPRFSPDGSQVVYSSDTDTDEDSDTYIWKVPILGGNPELMMKNASALSWIDDRHVLFSESRGGLHMAIVTANESRSQERDVYVPASTMGMAHRSYLSPDRKWVLIAEMEHGWMPCRLVPLDGSSMGKAVAPPGAGCTSAAWSPDGRWMYFSSSAAGGRFHIWRQRFPSGQPERVTSGPTEEEGIAMAPDGRSFISSVGIIQGAVWLHDGAGERQVPAEGSSEAPSFSLDGSKLFFLSRKSFAREGSGAGELWQMDLKSGRAGPILPDFSVKEYQVSPDARSVAFTRVNDKGESRLWLASLDRSSPPRQLDASQAETAPFFGGSGAIFFGAKNGPFTFFYRVNEDGSGLERVLTHPIIDFRGLSPDGKQVLLRVFVPIPKAPFPAGLAIMAYPIAGGTGTFICYNDCPAGWSGDGSSFYVGFRRWYQSEGTWTVGVIPLKSHQSIPRLPPFGIRSESDLAAIPGVRLIKLSGETMEFALGPQASTYAVMRTTVHRNLYRILTH